MSDTQTIPWKRWSRRKITIIFLIVLLGVLGGGGYLAQRLMAQPAVGTVVTSMPAMQRTEPVELKQFDGQYFSFVLPMSYVEQILKSPPIPNNLESRVFVATSMSSKTITATVSKLPSAKLEDDPSYTMRVQNPQLYQVKPAVLKNEKVMVSTNTDGQQFHQTVFWPHGDKLLTFTMSGAANNTQAMTAEFQDMIGTIAWR